MSASRPTAPSWATPLAALGLTVVVVVSVWLRWPGFAQGGFASHDVAGVLYNAMVLDRGGLPYVDTVELKAPGSFYLAWLMAGEGARDIARLQVWANLWAVAALVTVGVTGWRLWGPRGAVAAAAVYALHDAHLDSMDANYVTWANLPAVLAAAHGLAALDRRWPDEDGDPWPRWWRWGLAGALAGIAVLMKRPAGIMVLTVLGWSLLDAARWRSAGPSRGAWTAPVAVLLGVAVSQVPLLVHYAVRGALPSLISGFYGNRWGAHYVAHGAARLSVLAQLREAALSTAYFLAPALLLAAFAVARGSATRETGGSAGKGGAGMRALLADPYRTRMLALAVWAALSIAAAWVGFRFYKGYYLAAAAPLALMAAAPGGLLDLRRCLRSELPARGLVALMVLGLAVRQAALLGAMRADRARPHDLGGRTIATHLVANTEPDDTIWVWGWHLWDVYPLTGHMSGSRIYKSIGLLTPPNDDSWRRPATPATFVDGPAASLLLDDLRRTRPGYVVFGSTVPSREFDAMQAFLRRNYVRDRRVRIGRVQFWRRRAEALDTEPADQRPPQAWRPGLHTAPRAASLSPSSPNPPPSEAPPR